MRVTYDNDNTSASVVSRRRFYKSSEETSQLLRALPREQVQGITLHDTLTTPCQGQGLTRCIVLWRNSLLNLSAEAQETSMLLSQCADQGWRGQ